MKINVPPHHWVISKTYQKNMVVTFNTQKLIANRTREQTIVIASGDANKRALEADAIASVVEVEVAAEMFAYGNLSAACGLNKSNYVLDYIWWAEQEELVGKEFLVGLDPQSVIRTRSP